MAMWTRRKLIWTISRPTRSIPGQNSSLEPVKKIYRRFVSMKPFAAALALTTLFATGVAAQAPAPSETTGSEGSLAGGMVVNATLNSSVDSKKAKPGEQVTAHTSEAVKSSDGRMILPKGTKLVGHVTQASARSNGEGEAKLAIQFDKAVLKDKQEMPLNVVIQAIAPPAQEAAPAAFGGPGGAGGTSGGGTSTPSNNPSMSGSRGARPEGTPPAESYPSANSGGGPSGESGPLPANMRGVYGFSGVRMSANANGEGTVLTSTGKNVHLDGGTRLLLAVQPQSASAAPSGK
jgi:hypothetical protein